LMRYYVAAGSGGYQAFNLRGTEWAWLVFALVCSLVSLVVAVLLMRNVLAADAGTPKMQEIARAIQEGALAYLKRQFKTIGLIVIPLAVLVFVTATKVVDPATNHTVLGFAPSGIYRTLVFLLGATFSGLAGYIGMSTAVRGNVRTAAAARDGSMPAALRVAIRTGGVTGLFVVGFCHSRGIRLRRFSYRPLHARRWRHFHQGGRCRWRPGRQSRGRHP
jgi:K(+)-stimulated pyrophosphate-energized sodium pump